jgi:hypothetical protein
MSHSSKPIINSVNSTLAEWLLFPYDGIVDLRALRFLLTEQQLLLSIHLLIGSGQDSELLLALQAALELGMVSHYMEQCLPLVTSTYISRCWCPQVCASKETTVKDKCCSVGTWFIFPITHEDMLPFSKSQILTLSLQLRTFILHCVLGTICFWGGLFLQN